MDSGFVTENLPWLEFENETLKWRESFLLPVLLVLHLFLKCVGQHMAAPVRVCESRKKAFDNGGRTWSCCRCFVASNRCSF